MGVGGVRGGGGGSGSQRLSGASLKQAGRVIKSHSPTCWTHGDEPSHESAIAPGGVLRAVLRGMSASSFPRNGEKVTDSLCPLFLSPVKCGQWQSARLCS